MVDTYRARRRLKMGPDVWREPDELVPEAHTWMRAESWLHTGYITEAKDVSQKDFDAAVAKFCPDLADRLAELTGTAEGVNLIGPHKSPRRVYTPADVKPRVKPKAKSSS